MMLPELNLATPIDRGRWFICPTLTPLFYAPVYHQLSEAHQRRYNQLTALSFSELISFFETTFAGSVLAALDDSRGEGGEESFAARLEGFVEEERRHTEWWRQLNRLSEPDLYRRSDHAINHFPRSVRLLLRQVTKHPRVFPVVFWIMLAQEERSIEMSRRCLQMPVDAIEPRYLSIYRAHLQHEVRHVRIDRCLIERYYAKRPTWLRRINAKLFCALTRQYLLPPTRSAIRVVSRLVSEHPELQSLHGVFLQQLEAVGADAGYHQMMYSRESTPITFALFDRFPEFRGMRHVLRTYDPRATSERNG
jgi:hypothetical protein